MTGRLRTVLDGLSFGEAPRWRNDGLYFVDIYAHQIALLRHDGTRQNIATLGGPVSGLGWLPDGRLLVVSMRDKRVMRRESDGRFVVHADLSEVATGYANDMVVAANGTAFVGNFGFSLFPPAEFRPAPIVAIAIDGTVRIAAPDLAFPNGMVITPDGATLIVAESRGRKLTAFDLTPDASLSNRRNWASLPEGAFPDGMCLDEDGAIWVASPSTCDVIRMVEGGQVMERIPTGQQAIACALGGEGRKTLYILTAESRDPAYCRVHHTARLQAVCVAIGGCGLP
jgi:sugar lactone lactonase YvrE